MKMTIKRRYRISFFDLTFSTEEEALNTLKILGYDTTSSNGCYIQEKYPLDLAFLTEEVQKRKHADWIKVRDVITGGDD